MAAEPAEVNRPRALPREYEIAEVALHRYSDLLEQLERELTPILTQQVPMTADPRPDKVPQVIGDSPIVLQTRERNTTMTGLNDRLSSLIKRIEL